MPTHSRRHGPGSWNRSSGTWAPSSGSGDLSYPQTHSRPEGGAGPPAHLGVRRDLRPCAARRLTGVDGARTLTLAGEELPAVGTARMYVCGITPYDTTHLGHAAMFVWA